MRPSCHGVTFRTVEQWRQEKIAANERRMAEVQQQLTAANERLIAGIEQQLERPSQGTVAVGDGRIAELERHLAVANGRVAELEQRLIATNERLIAELEQRLESKGLRLTEPANVANWRRRIVKVVSRLEASRGRPREEVSPCGKGPAARIGRLSEEGVIPRRVAALMRTVLEMRNALEYESEMLSYHEHLAAWGAWLAIQEWAGKNELQI